MLLGLLCWTALPCIWLELDRHFKRAEPFFTPPIYLNSKHIPLRQDDYGKGYFGASRNGGRKHKGIDILAPIASPILSAKSGRVVFTGEDKKGYGFYIEILHPNNLRTRYAHLKKIWVRAGDWVSRGQMVGECGKTGNAAGAGVKPHLHFEILTSYGPLNPTKELLRRG